jgi:cytochrome c-type biogenesis protein CcmH/NrfG
MKPESVEARDKLGLMYAQQGRLEDAIVQFREAIRIKPSDPIARQSLAKVEAQR